MCFRLHGRWVSSLDRCLFCAAAFVGGANSPDPGTASAGREGAARADLSVEGCSAFRLAEWIKLIIVRTRQSRTTTIAPAIKTGDGGRGDAVRAHARTRVAWGT